ncbi:racemase [Oceaniferula spumae]|uniref:Racemase n=1 Tax=Oceaniferula spumae TaxID=2979115 RepID=A0AAT9FM47_9BACT
MKKFGLIGGTSWRSTIAYYERINSSINAIHNDNTNPPLSLVSLNQKLIHEHQRNSDWKSITALITEAADELQEAGVEAIAFCATTPHKVFHDVQPKLHIPILHIADAMAEAAGSLGATRLGLLGTRFTMAECFLRDRLKKHHGLDTLVPPAPVQKDIQAQVYKDLSSGIFDETAKRTLLDAMEKLAQRGAEAIVLGCTEFPFLINSSDTSLPLINAIDCHCNQITRFIKGELSTDFRKSRPSHLPSMIAWPSQSET